MADPRAHGGHVRRQGPEEQHAQHAIADGHPAVPDSPALASNTKPFGALMNEAMATMDNAMKGAPMTGDPDHDFVAVMIRTTKAPSSWRKRSCSAAGTPFCAAWHKKSL